MRQSKSLGFGLPEFASAIAALAIVSVILHPVLAHARTGSRGPSAFRPNMAFQMYAADVDGGFDDFKGKPILLDRLNQTVLRYGGIPGARPRKRGGDAMTGCMPILRFAPSSYVAEPGSLTYWDGQVGSAMGGCSIYSAVADASVLQLPDWGDVPTDDEGNFTLVAGAMDEGVGTMGVMTNTGAVAVDSVLVVGS